MTQWTPTGMINRHNSENPDIYYTTDDSSVSSFLCVTSIGPQLLMKTISIIVFLRDAITDYNYFNYLRVTSSGYPLYNNRLYNHEVLESLKLQPTFITAEI